MIESSVYVSWNVFFFLELLGVKYIVKREFRTIRFFLAFCALRDVGLFIVGNHMQAYWDIGWLTKQVEIVWLAWIAGHIASLAAGKYEWPMRVPAIGIAALSLVNLPFSATPDKMHNYQWHCHIIILGTVLIGCLLTIEPRHRRLAIAVAIFSASGLISAVSFVRGNFAPMAATMTWILGLLVLLAALKETSGQCGSLIFHRSAQPDERPGRRSKPPSAPKPESVSLPLQEWTAWPSRTQIQ